NTSRLLCKDGDPTKELNNFFEILIEDLQKQIKKLNNKTKHLQNLIIKNKNEYNCNIQNLQVNLAMKIYNSIKKKDEEINTLH
ncbi:3686_t:CDS:1, partial [Gigaspora margarita]